MQYDYRGMINVFKNLDNLEKVAEYAYLLNSWKILREYRLTKNNDAIVLHKPPKPISQFLDEILENCLSSPSESAS